MKFSEKMAKWDQWMAATRCRRSLPTAGSINTRSTRTKTLFGSVATDVSGGSMEGGNSSSFSNFRS